MAQQKEISISTISTLIDSTSTYTSEVIYDNNNPNIILNVDEFKTSPSILICEIAEQVKHRDTTKCLECELIVTLKEDSNLTVDIDGNLLILHTNPTNFTINEMGELIYNF